MKYFWLLCKGFFNREEKNPFQWPLASRICEGRTSLWERGGCFASADVRREQKEGKHIFKCIFFSTLVSGERPELPNILKTPFWHSGHPPRMSTRVSRWLQQMHHPLHRCEGRGPIAGIFLSLLPLPPRSASRLLHLQAEPPTPALVLARFSAWRPWGVLHYIQVSAQTPSFERGITSFNPFALFTLFCLILLKDLLSAYIATLICLLCRFQETRRTPERRQGFGPVHCHSPSTRPVPNAVQVPCRYELHYSYY